MTHRSFITESLLRTSLEVETVTTAGEMYTVLPESGESQTTGDGSKIWTRSGWARLTLILCPAHISGEQMGHQHRNFLLSSDKTVRNNKLNFGTYAEQHGCWKSTKPNATNPNTADPVFTWFCLRTQNPSPSVINWWITSSFISV